MTMRHIGDVAESVIEKIKPRIKPSPPAGIEITPIIDRKSWLDMRHNDVTASAAGALLGCHDYITAYSLWADKAGLVTEDGEITESMERGIELEPIALRRLAKQHQKWDVVSPGQYLRDPVVRLGATPDAYVMCPDKGFGIVQIKSVEPSVFRRKWHNEDGEVEPPLWIAVQATIEAHLTGAKWAAVAALVISHGIELNIVDVPLLPKLVDRINGEVRDFWRMIDEGRKPDPDWKRDGRLLEQLYEPSGEIVDMTDDNSLPAICDEKDRLSKLVSESGKRLKEIKAEMLAKLGDTSQARIADGRIITVKRVERKGYEVKPSSYIDVRIKAERTAS